MKFRHAYDDKYNPKDYETKVITDGDMTQQSFKEACDINNILNKYNKTGVIEHVNKFEAQYGDIDGATFTEMQFQVAEAKSMFQELPAKARDHFENDPAKFLDFADKIDMDEPAQVELLKELKMLDPNSTHYHDFSEPRGKALPQNEDQPPTPPQNPPGLDTGASSD